MLLRFDSPASGADYILDTGEFVTPSVAGGGQVICNGTKAVSGTLTISAGGQVISGGLVGGTLRFDSPLETAGYLFDTIAARSQAGQVTISGGGQVIANGQAGAAGPVATITGGGSVATSGEKGAVGTWYVEYWVHLTSEGRKDAKGQATVTAGGQVTGFGYPGFTARVRGGGQLTATPAKGGEVIASVTAGGLVTATGQANVPPIEGIVTITGGGQVTATGTKQSIIKSGDAVVAGGGQLVVTGTGARLKYPAVEGGGQVGISATTNRLGSLTISGGGQVIAFKPTAVKSTVWLLVEPAA